MTTCRQDYENRYHKIAAALPYDAYERIWKAAQAAMTVTVVEATSILAQTLTGRLEGVDGGKGGRAWLEGEFDLAQLEAICVLARHAAGDSAEGARQLVDAWNEAASNNQH